jgi:hypothetical protein
VLLDFKPELVTMPSDYVTSQVHFGGFYSIIYPISDNAVRVIYLTTISEVYLPTTGRFIVMARAGNAPIAETNYIDRFHSIILSWMLSKRLNRTIRFQ